QPFVNTVTFRCRVTALEFEQLPSQGTAPVSLLFSSRAVPYCYGAGPRQLRDGWDYSAHKTAAPSSFIRGTYSSWRSPLLRGGGGRADQILSRYLRLGAAMGGPVKTGIAAMTGPPLLRRGLR